MISGSAGRAHLEDGGGDPGRSRALRGVPGPPPPPDPAAGVPECRAEPEQPIPARVHTGAPAHPTGRAGSAECDPLRGGCGSLNGRGVSWKTRFSLHPFAERLLIDFKNTPSLLSVLLWGRLPFSPSSSGIPSPPLSSDLVLAGRWRPCHAPAAWETLGKCSLSLGLLIRQVGSAEG